MTKRVLGVLAALAMMGGSAIACSSSSTPAPAGGADTGVKDTGGTDAKTDSKTDGGTPDAPEPVCDKTTGKTCATNEECDVTGEATNVCSVGLNGGSYYATNICLGLSCDAGDGTKVEYCDCDTGVCLATSSGGICLPLCQWKDDGAAPVGCEGKNACNPYAWGTDTTTMAPVGIGYCWGGCKADTDCPSGNKCEKGTGLCLKAPDVYVKNVGDACTDTDASAMPSKCNCLYATNAAGSKSGYCSQTCRMGDAGACPSGFTCDAMLPKTKIADDDVVFTKAPAGLAGSCLKDCAADADCEANNGYCEETAGTGKKTCQVGLRPCMKNEQCPTGKTCQGATASSFGRCKA